MNLREVARNLLRLRVFKVQQEAGQGKKGATGASKVVSVPSRVGLNASFQYSDRFLSLASVICPDERQVPGGGQ